MELVDSSAELSDLWANLQDRAYPRDAPDEVDEVDLHELDTYAAGCIATALSGSIDHEKRHILMRCAAELDRVVPRLSGDAKTHFEMLQRAAQLALSMPERP